MAHGITTHDTMLSANGVTPWHRHKNARVLPGKVRDVQTALRASGLDWRVEKRPIMLADGSGAIVPDTFAMVRPDTGAVFGTVGKVYVPLQNDRAFEGFRPWLDSGLVEIETAGSLHGGRVVWILAALAGAHGELAGGDEIKGYVLFTHSHDGGQSIRVGFTSTRVVCANTLAMARREQDGTRKGGGRAYWTVRHTAAAEQSIADVRREIEAMLRAHAESMAVYQELAAQPVQSAEHVKAYVAAAFGPAELEQQSKGKDSRRAKAIVRNFVQGTGQDLQSARGTYWGLYNALTEYVTHQAGRDDDSRIASATWGDGAKTSDRGLDVARVMAKGIPIEDVLDLAVVERADDRRWAAMV